MKIMQSTLAGNEEIDDVLDADFGDSQVFSSASAEQWECKDDLFYDNIASSVLTARGV